MKIYETRSYIVEKWRGIFYNPRMYYDVEIYRSPKVKEIASRVGSGLKIEVENKEKAIKLAYALEKKGLEFQNPDRLNWLGDYEKSMFHISNYGDEFNIEN